MAGLVGMDIEPGVLVWGPEERVSPLWGRLTSTASVCWAYDQPQTPPEGFQGRILWGVDLLKLQGSYGRFVCGFSDGSQVQVGQAVLFPDDLVLDEPEPAAGQSVAMLLTGAYRGVFARALQGAQRLALAHQVYIITDDIQVGYPGGEDAYSQARAAGVIFFRTAGWDLRAVPSGGYEIELPGQNVLLQVDRVADYRQAAVGAWPRDFRLGPMSVSGVLNTRREGIYVFPAGEEIAPGEEELLYEALAARLTTGPDETGSDQGLEVDADRCALCLTCYRICPHQAIELISAPGITNLYGMAAAINPAACRRCDACRAACPAAAIRGGEAEPGHGIILACENSGWDNRRTAVGVRLYPCVSAISSADILRALAGREQVVIYACREGSCRHAGCGPQIESRIDRLRALMEQLGMAADIRLLRRSAAEIG